MANDRVWLRCDCCYERILLFKYYPAGNGFVYHRDRALDEWFLEHLHDHGNGRDLREHHGFRAVIESQES